MTKDNNVTTLTLISLLCIFFLGCVTGWIIRTQHTNNKAGMAAFERYTAEKDYYETRTRILKAHYESGKGIGDARLK